MTGGRQKRQKERKTRQIESQKQEVVKTKTLLLGKALPVGDRSIVHNKARNLKYFIFLVKPDSFNIDSSLPVTVD